VGGKEVQPGVWVARNVTIHPTATLSPPAFLGENSRIGPLAIVGPSASIGRDCMIESETFVSHSVICRGSYVGRKLALRDVMVNHSHLVNTRWEAEIEDVDSLLLGSIWSEPLGDRVRRAAGRYAAALATVVASPVLAGLYAASKMQLVPAVRKEMIVLTPTASAPYRWRLVPLRSFGTRHEPSGGKGWVKHFFFRLLPALPSIAIGHIAIFGEAPQTRDEAELLTASMRAATLRARSGILPLEALHQAGHTEDESIPEVHEIGWRMALTLGGRYAGLVARDTYRAIFKLGAVREA
jgi:hypothetical protein